MQGANICKSDCYKSLSNYCLYIQTILISTGALLGAPSVYKKKEKDSAKQ